MLKKSKNNFWAKGFTLIELLVVIAVIGLLSSIIMASIQGVREKARVAKIVQFSATLHHGLAVDAVGVWNLDEGPGQTTIQDLSGNGYNGTCSGDSCPQWTDETPYKTVGAGQGKYALNFDGSDDGIDLGEMTQGFSQLTVSAWVKCSGCTSNGGTEPWGIIFERGTWHEGAIELSVAKGTYCPGTGDYCAIFEAINSGGIEGQPNSKTIIADNRWHFIVGTYDGSKVKIYVDSKLEDTKNLTGIIALSAAPSATDKQVYIGRYPGSPGWTNNFDGIIDEVRFYSQALTSAEIKKLYAKGLEGHNTQ